MKELYQLLNQSEASDFLIRQTTTLSREAFFIGQKLDMGRAKKVTHTFVTVYVDSEDKKYRGSAVKEIHPTCTAKEIQKEIESAIFAAKFVQNPWYPLVSDQTCEAAPQSFDLNEQLAKIVSGMQSVSASADEKINSYEIFVEQKQTRIINSRGVDVSFSNFACEVEAVINARKDGHEIELFKVLHFADKPANEITAEIEKMFLSGHQRLNAAPTRKNEHANLLLSGDDVVEFFHYFTAHTNASNQYMGVGKAKIGEKITGDEADPLTIRLIPSLNGSTKNEPYDQDGNPVTERVLFRDGICQSFWGSTQHAYYIGMKDTTSSNNLTVCGGTASEAELRSLPHLEVTDFSDFQMDPVTGYFGGEIRLGYESDGVNRHSVTGGSVSANFSKVLGNIRFSKETRQINNCIVPCAVYLTDVSISGE
ncbi:MAG: metallopeptidase TldD-related protein [Fusicatenibacter sp.]|nr:metallopeptidase TldD-related protein [Lachnospiraceae bacterium]MDY2937107.1 metallopeptidase TldD-related protein [Fusicatenibacter sp.]